MSSRPSSTFIGLAGLEAGWRGLVICRDRRSIVACAVFDQLVDNFQRKTASSAAYGRVKNNTKKTNIFFPVFPMAAVREYLQPIHFLNSFETKL